ncbi:type II secretion system protein GspM [Vulgatibacter incomptus]|uniref:General secretion pathway protein M n=1 Tax=Vulgatibacter incomptus TaxID=1391653 RepID=A0A0K1PCT0_9BACT|nr:type II secretion system protein GspM [Vulgatibacter incomptus]AKU91330.1 General secretion pathway protein M [Vulgatibacter incomptus]
MALPFQSAIDKATQSWSSLSLRERRMLALLFSAFVVTVLFMGFASMRKSMAQHDESIAEKRLQLQKVAVLAAGFREAELARTRIESRIRGTPVRLFSYLEDIAKKQSLAIGDMQDRGSDSAGDGIQRSTVEVSFAQIDLKSLINFLNEIEKSPHLVKIEKLRVRHRNDNPDLLDANFTVSTYQLTQS